MKNSPLQNTNTAGRLTTYSALSTELALLSDCCLVALLEKAMPLGTSICGATVLLNLSKTPVFVKKIRLTDIEKQAENVMSTANLFNLPMRKLQNSMNGLIFKGAEIF